MTDRETFVRDNALVLIDERDAHIAVLKKEVSTMNHAHGQQRALIRRLREQLLSLGVEPVD